MFTSLLVATILFSNPRARAGDAAPAPLASTFCSEVLVPPRARAFARHLSRSAASADVARRLVDAADRPESFVRLDVGPYQLRGLLTVKTREVRLRVARMEKVGASESSVPSLRSPLLEPWSGLADGLAEIVRTRPRVERVFVDGLEMRSAKFARLLQRRLGFHQMHMGEADWQLAMWNVPDGRASALHRARFAAHAVIDVGRRVFWIW